MNNQAIFKHGDPVTQVIEGYTSGVGVVYSFDLVDDKNEGFQLDTGYTLEIGGETFTVGNGLGLSSNLTGEHPVYTIAWAVPENTFTTVGRIKGKLFSDSMSYPTFFQSLIILEVNDSIC